VPARLSAVRLPSVRTPQDVRSEILTAVATIASYSLVRDYRCFKVTYYPITFALKMEAISSSETISAYKTPLRHDPEYHTRYLHGRENLIPHRPAEIAVKT
jgi:hypothetical protein